MRTTLVIAILLIPSISAFSELGTDATGDAAAGIDDVTGPVPFLVDGIDVLALRANETAEYIHLQIETDPLDLLDGYPARFDIDTQFTYRNQTYQARISYTADIQNPSNTYERGELHRVTASTGSIHWLQDVPAHVDTQGGLHTISVPRSLIRGQDGTPLIAGEVLTQWRTHASRFYAAISQDGSGQTGAIHADDFLPDEGHLSVDFPIQLGATQSKHLYLDSKDPIRYSNGEAKTFAYVFEAHYSGSETRQIQFSTSGAPTSWSVTIPVPEVTLSPNESFTGIVLVSVPFAHQHGRDDLMTIHATSPSDASLQGSVEVGIHYPDIPQPAGHHDALYVHAAQGTRIQGETLVAYMNALDEDASSVPGLVPANDGTVAVLSGTDPLPGDDTWRIPLEPELLIGLAFRPDQVAEFQGEITARRIMNDVTARGQLIALEPTGRDYEAHTIGVSETVEIGSVSPGQTIDLELSISIDSEWLNIPARSGWNIRFDLRLEGINAIGDQRAELAQGAELRLPLLEVIDSELGTQGAIDITGIPAEVQRVQPGRQALIEFTANAPEDMEFAFAIHATHASWATTNLRAGVHQGPQDVQILIEPPATANPGEPLDIVAVFAPTDGSAPSIVRIAALTDSEGADLTGLAIQPTDQNDTPFAPIWFMVTVLGAATLALRRTAQGKP